MPLVPLLTRDLNKLKVIAIITCYCLALLTISFRCYLIVIDDLYTDTTLVIVLAYTYIL